MGGAGRPSDRPSRRRGGEARRVTDAHSDGGDGDEKDDGGDGNNSGADDYGRGGDDAVPSSLGPSSQYTNNSFRKSGRQGGSHVWQYVKMLKGDHPD